MNSPVLVVIPSFCLVMGRFEKSARFGFEQSVIKTLRFSNQQGSSLKGRRVGISHAQDPHIPDPGFFGFLGLEKLKSASLTCCWAAVCSE